MIRNLIYKIKLFSSPRKGFYSYIRGLTGHPIKFKLYDIAFIHKSASYVDKMGMSSTTNGSNTGDAVLGTIVTNICTTASPLKTKVSLLN